MKKIFLFVFFILSFIGYSQEDILKDTEYIQFKEASIELHISDGYFRYMDVQDEFLKKRPDDYLENQDNYESWIEQNLSKSKFKDLDEALALHKELIDLTAIYEPQILKLFDKYGDLSDKYGEVEFRDVFYNDVQEATKEAFLVQLKNNQK
ncbi:hypothetical protein [Flavobacterium sp. I3-2]|uniref:hypothetical protein n=1 Tax=Flavobacterium sp. I3-2 TaxID=2748319 RepID=UPI0015A7B89C|nr:hypothetical protein [Flavobacterium sp. I3-2]